MADKEKRQKLPYAYGSVCVGSILSAADRKAGFLVLCIKDFYSAKQRASQKYGEKILQAGEGYGAKSICAERKMG